MKRNNNIHLASTDTCTGCSACASICPTGSISMKEDREGFLQPLIDTKTCIGCHKCEKTCPIITPIKIPTDFETQAFAAINKDEAVRMRSSSGGIFYALAKLTIEQGGVVFGARFNENWEVVHDYTETIKGIEPFMCSKYVQSCIGETFKQAKQFLEQNRHVLFVGTPCQIGGLKSYLHKDYDNLLTVDIICHGVPSPGVWRKYINKKFDIKKISDISFRDKEDGWLVDRCVTIKSETGVLYRQHHLKDMYFMGFVMDIYLRRSCYDCQFKQYQRMSDMTIADFWGVQQIYPELNDNKGISLVFCHTQRGRQTLLNLQDIITTTIPECESIVRQYNPSMVESARKKKKRDMFFRISNVCSVEYSVRILLKDSLLKRSIRKIKKVTNKIKAHL